MKKLFAGLCVCILLLCGCKAEPQGEISHTGSGFASQSAASSSSDSPGGQSVSSTSHSTLPYDESCPSFDSFEELIQANPNDEYRLSPHPNTKTPGYDWTEENILWRPDVDNSIGVDDAYGDAVVSYPYFWSVHQSCLSGPIYYAYIHYEPELTFMRQVDDSHYYVVFNAEGGGRLFLFYTPRQLKMEGLENVLRDYMRLYVYKTLSYSDFDGITAGDSIDEVIAVDKTAQLAKNEYDIADAYKYSMHLLKDGLLIITYDKTDGNIVVKDKIFSEDFIFDYFSLFNFTDEQFALMEEKDLYMEQYRQVKILPQDYPPETRR